MEASALETLPEGSGYMAGYLYFLIKDARDHPHRIAPALTGNGRHHSRQAASDARAAGAC
jgi:hypothetical protein